MDLEDIRKLDKVVDRLEAAGPSGISAPHCWFCGKIEAWFGCDCRDAQDAREDKRNKPRVIQGGGKMLVILDPEVMEREHNRRRKRYVPSPSVAPVTPVRLTPSVDSVDSKMPSVDSAVSTAPIKIVHASSDEKATARRAYKAEHERQRRAKAKDKP